MADNSFENPNLIGKIINIFGKDLMHCCLLKSTYRIRVISAAFSLDYFIVLLAINILS